MRTVRIVAATVFTILLLTTAAAIWFLKPEGLSAKKKPSNFEYAIANFALAQSIPASAKQRMNPVEATPENLRKGKDDFHDHCAVCHDDDGTGKTPVAAGMSPEVPDLHAAHVQKWTDGELFFIINNGVRFTGMPGWNFDEDRIWRLVLAVRGFRP